MPPSSGCSGWRLRGSPRATPRGCSSRSAPGCCWVSPARWPARYGPRAELGDLGLRLDNWRRAAALGLGFAAVQFTLTLWGYDLPRPVEWIPLLVMSLVVGFFEAVF